MNMTIGYKSIIHPLTGETHQLVCRTVDNGVGRSMYHKSQRKYRMKTLRKKP